MAEDRCAAIYEPSGPGGEIVLYRGTLRLVVADSAQEYHGQLELTLSPKSVLEAHVAGLGPVAWELAGEDPEVGLPHRADLNVPMGYEMPTPPDDAAIWSDTKVPINHVRVGAASEVERLVFHISGLRTKFGFSDRTRDRTLKFQLRGWDLEVVELRDDDPSRFSHVVHAVRPRGEINDQSVGDLGRALFVLLTLVENGEVGTYPVAGLGPGGSVVWADWAAPRTRGRKGVRGLSSRLIDEALPTLAQGLDVVATDAALLAIVDRATGYLSAVGGGEVLDLRIPMACSGLELLSWAVLQRENWLSRDTLGKLSSATAASVRLFLKWAGIPSAIPNGLPALNARRAALGGSDWEGPDVLFNVRNALVHPPKHLDDPEWPSKKELLESWQLASWYLELGLLRLLRYDGPYWSRLRLGRFEGDVEPVPWSRTKRDGPPATVDRQESKG